MATQKGVWDIQDIRDKQLQDLWSYSGEKQLFAWGRNEDSSARATLGLNDEAARSSPTQVTGTTWSGIRGSIERQGPVALKNDGTLWTWGINDFGQQGDNENLPATNMISSPKQVPGTTWDGGAVGIFFKMGTKTDGTLWSWGSNVTYGMLGHSNLTEYSSPNQVGSNTNWSGDKTKLSAANHVLAIKTDGTLWGWGRNNAGQLGTQNTTNYSSPRQVPGTNWSSVSCGYWNSLATKTDGTLWSWGANAATSLGHSQPTDTYYSSPKQIPGTNWKITEGGINCRRNSMSALKTDGTLWSWGSNSYGELGLNNRTQKSSPEQVPGTTWDKFTQGGRHESMALKTDGTLWSWGENNYGEVGDITRVRRSSPTQIPGTSWLDLASIYEAKFAIKNV